VRTPWRSNAELIAAGEIEPYPARVPTGEPKDPEQRASELHAWAWHLRDHPIAQIRFRQALAIEGLELMTDAQVWLVYLGGAA
jgi:hypothetical protein